MAEPIISFGYNNTTASGCIDTAWPGINPSPGGNWKLINPATDLVVFTGGGILGALPNPCASGTRDATIRPSVTSFVIPQTFVEQEQMYITPAGYNTNRYVFGVRVNGTATSDIYLEAWDDNSFSTTDLEILTGTPNSDNNSFVNAIRTTTVEPPWEPGWDGNSAGAAFLRGTEHRIGLSNSSAVTDTTLYYNIYIRLETDCSTFHVMPVLAFRYLYT